MQDVRLRIAAAFVAVALVLGLLTLVFWEFVRSTIIVPIYYSVWIGGLVLKSIPEAAFLAVFLVLCAIVGLSALGISMSGNARRGPPVTASPVETRYHHWERLCANLYFSRFSRNLFTSDARRLIIAVLAYEYRLEPREVEALVRDGQLDLPETIRSVLTGNDELFVEQPLTRLSKTARRFRREAASDPQTDALLNEIVTFIESHLEIMHVGNQPETRN